MTSPSVEDLYKAYDSIVSADGDEAKVSEAFTLILNACSGGASEKRLASQFIARFFNKQPTEVQEKAFYRMIDLCEDEEVVIRRQAVLDLGTLARANPAFQNRISDVLVQMLTAEDTQEHNLVEQALVRLLTKDTHATLNSIFTQILMGAATSENDDGDENRSNSEIMREAAIKFVASQLRRLPEETLKPDLEEFIVEQVKKILEDVSEEEFLQLITILASLKSMSSLVGRQNLVNLISEQVVGESANGSFDSTELSSVARVTECAKQAVLYMSKNVHAKSFVEFFLDKVIPKISEISREEPAPEESFENGNSTPPHNNPRLDLLRAFAQMTPHHGPQIEVTDDRLAPLLTALCNEMPLPPSTTAEDSAEKTDEGEDDKDLHFSEVECLLFAMHQLARLNTEFLTKDEERLKDFRQRLQYFSRRSNAYLRSLQTALQSKTKEELNDGENKLRVVALKLTNNIHLLIRDLFKNPPSYKTSVNLSWISPNAAASAGLGTAAKRPAAYEEDTTGGAGAAKRRNQERAPYRPPMGKYSERAGAPPAQRGWGGSNWNRGGRGRRF